MNKVEAWIQADIFLNPIIDRHGLKKEATGGAIFTQPTTVYTEVEQHLTHIMTVADWLMEE